MGRHPTILEGLILEVSGLRSLRALHRREPYFPTYYNTYHTGQLCNLRKIIQLKCSAHRKSQAQSLRPRSRLVRLGAGPTCNKDLPACSSITGHLAHLHRAGSEGLPHPHPWPLPQGGTHCGARRETQVGEAEHLSCAPALPLAPTVLLCKLLPLPDLSFPTCTSRS